MASVVRFEIFIMYVFTCVFSEVVEFLKILGIIFGEKKHPVPKYFLFWEKRSWQGTDYVALYIWPMVRAPIALTSLCVIHLKETELGKQKISFSIVIFLESGGQRGIVEWGQREGREGGEKDKIYLIPISSWTISILEMKGAECILFNPFPIWKSLFQLLWQNSLNTLIGRELISL